MRFRPLPIMTACMVPALAILFMLGHWQWQRYTEKQGYVDAEIAWISFEGERQTPTFMVSTILNGRSAWRRINLIDAGNEAVFVSDTAYISINPPSVSLVGSETASYPEAIFVTPAGANALTPSPSENTFYAYDVEQLKARLEGDLASRVRSDVLEPRFLSVMDLEQGGQVERIENPWANPELADPLPPARHLGYALTWWGLGLGLIVIYLVFHLQSGRLTLKQAA
ncbi:MAG: SURF1 family cytochrome oxidase biogenesis protein [Pseudomonadota bacterium]